MKIGIGIGDIAGAPADLDGLIAQARRAEEDGFASGWFANIMGFDAMLAAAFCARATSRIELGTAVVPTYPRHPHAMAQEALSAQAAARGRFALGIGLSHQIVIEGMFGFSFAKPFSHMKEYLAVLAPLIRTGMVSYAGEEYRVNAQLSVPGAARSPRGCSRSPVAWRTERSRGGRARRPSASTPSRASARRRPRRGDRRRG